MSNLPTNIKPPKWADKILSWFCADNYFEEVQGDLHEWFSIRVQEQGENRARLIYPFDMIRYFRSFRLKTTQQLNSNSNYLNMKQLFKLTYRNANKDRFSAFLKILNLTMGLAIFLLAITYARYEFSYDNHHKDVDNIYRVGQIQVDENKPWAASPMGLGAYMKENISNVTEMSRFTRISSTWIKQGNEIFAEKRGFYAEATVFNIFSCKSIYGDLNTALVAPDGIVLTESMALKYFGQTDVIGELLELEVDGGRSRKITAVIEDLPEQTHLRFDYLLPLNVFSERYLTAWRNWGTYTYVKLAEGTILDVIKLPIINEYMEQYNVNTEGAIDIAFTPINKIHLFTNHEKEVADNGNVSYVYILMSIGIFVLLISCINFINVSVVKGLDRAKEVALRKTVGASRSQVILQFMGESFIILIISGMLSLAILAVVSPMFGNFSGLSLPLNVFEYQEILLPLAIIIALLELICGVYPAVVLSKFKPSVILKSGSNNRFRSPGLGLLRKGLITFQFVVSMVLMVSSFVIYQQLDHIQQENLGFEKDQILLIEMNNSLGNKYDAFVSELSNITGVNAVTGSSSVPSNRIMMEGIQALGGTEVHNSRILMTDENFSDVYGLQIIAGSGFIKNTDNAPIQYLLNETAALLLFENRDPVNQMMAWGRDTGKVVGVVRDFNFQSLHHDVEPLTISSRMRGSWLSLRFSPTAVGSVIEGIENVSHNLFPDLPSIEYQFMSDRFEQLYLAETRLKSIVWVFCIISILLTVTGIFGMATYTAKQRTKEIAIRKVLGSEVYGLLKLLSKEFVVLLAVALLLAIPAGIKLSDWWLQSFSNRVAVGPELYMIAVLSIIFLVLGSAVFVTFRAVAMNPVDALKNE
jgi:putative ABC transport system permease protein